MESTLLIGDGCVKEVVNGRFISEQFTTEDLGELVIMPGLIDSHVHINDPGRTGWEGFEYATKAAAAGGITTLIDMPLNSSPVTISKSSLHQKIAATKDKLYVHCGFWGGLIPDNADTLEELLSVGVWGLKAFLCDSGNNEFPAVSGVDLKKAMALLRHHQIPLLVHAEWDKKGSDISAMEAQPWSYPAYLHSRPDSWENDAIQFLIGLIEEYRCKTHIVHLSSTWPFDSIKKAKQMGLPVTCETCPHYLSFHSEIIPDSATLFKCAPPIRTRANNEKLWDGLKYGIIDFIVSDHSPSPPTTKYLTEGSFLKAWGGISGLQWSLPVVWTIARKRGISLKQLTEWMSSKIAEFVGLGKTKGKIEKGYDADLIVWDPEEKFEVTASEMYSRHYTTPYLGMLLRGKVKRTYLKGQLVCKDGRFIGGPKGKILLRN